MRGGTYFVRGSGKRRRQTWLRVVQVTSRPVRHRQTRDIHIHDSADASKPAAKTTRTYESGQLMWTRDIAWCEVLGRSRLFRRAVHARTRYLWCFVGTWRSRNVQRSWAHRGQLRSWNNERDESGDDARWWLSGIGWACAKFILCPSPTFATRIVRS